MPFRFRRSFRVIPGVRLNVWKSGVSTSIGRRGAWFTIGPRGTRTTVGIPGTGLSYTQAHNRRAHDMERRRSGSGWFGLLVTLILLTGFALAIVASR